MKTAFVSVIFPANLKYFGEFITSLSEQTTREFQLILFNDGCPEEQLHSSLRISGLSYRVIPAAKGNPVQIRGQMMNYLKKTGYDVFVFGDTDDFFSTNRIESSLEWIEHKGSQLVFNDLTLIGREGNVLVERIWRDSEYIHSPDYTNILKGNPLGLGNTAIRAELLDFELDWDPGILAFDWMFYLQVLWHKRPDNCHFVRDAITYYRQHESNTLGLGNTYSAERIRNLFCIKEKFMNFAIRLGVEEALMEKEELMIFKECILNRQKALEKHITELNHKKGLLWFGEITNEI